MVDVLLVVAREHGHGAQRFFPAGLRVDDVDAVGQIGVHHLALETHLEVGQLDREDRVLGVAGLENGERLVVEHHAGWQPRLDCEGLQVVPDEVQVALLHDAALLPHRS